MREIERNEIIRLLRLEVKKAGSQAAWARKAGVERSMVNKVLFGRKPPSKKIILALKLRIIVVSS
jgi:hypothetical protein